MPNAALAFDRFKPLQDDACDSRIVAAKAALGKRAVILGHHYQRADVYKHADLTGDSLQLSRLASQTDADYIVFCGVHFMAEVADILSKPSQVAILPDMNAGCSMADMANLAKVERAWRELAEVLDPDENITPVTYINSAADLKAFCGEHGGIVCTSSNASKAMAWAWDQAEKLMMLPDQHLGRNTAYKMCVPLDEMVLWDPDLPNGGVSLDALRHARLVLWKGHCSVHTRFSVKQIEHFRATHPTGKVIVHPECTFDVVQAADLSGSTETIVRTVKASPPGSIWAVGTEIHLVNRLAHDVAPDRTVMTLDAVGCLCSTMFRISPNHLLWALEGLVAGEVRNRIVVPEPTKTFARVALDRMLEEV